MCAYQYDCRDWNNSLLAAFAPGGGGAWQLHAEAMELWRETCSRVKSMHVHLSTLLFCSNLLSF